MTTLDDNAVPLEVELFGDPPALLAKLGETGPIHSVTLPDGMPAWLITGYREARKALADARLRRNGTVAAAEFTPYLQGIYSDSFFPHSMVFNDQPDHTRMKKVVSQAFTPRQMERLRPRVQRIADRLIDAVAPHGKADVLHDLALQLPNAVICEWFDIPESDRAEFVRHCEVVTGLTVSTGDDQLASAGRWFNEYLAGVISDRQAHPGEDMISAMIESQATEKTLSDIEMRSNIFLMLIGSVETAVNMVSNGTLALLRNPDALALLTDNPQFLGSAVEEILRTDAPVMTVMYHFAAERLTIGDVEIQPGEHVAVSLMAANYDSSVFSDPTHFDIRRASAPHLSFSHGVHFCLGAPLARLEGEVLFGSMLSRMKNLQLAIPEAELSWRPSFLVRRLIQLPVTFTPTGKVVL
jgi:cytochrome P450